MSMVDAREELSDAQALTASADSTNVVDLTQTARQIGAGKPMFVHFNVPVAASTGNANETYEFRIATGAAASLGTSLNALAIARGTLIAGYKFSMAFPNVGVLRYVGVEYVLGGTSPTITMDAYISDQEAPSWAPYADAI